MRMGGCFILAALACTSNGAVEMTNFGLGVAVGAAITLIIVVAAILLLTRGPGSPDWTGYEDD